MKRFFLACCVVAGSLGSAAAADLGGYRTAPSACGTWGYSELVSRYDTDVNTLMSEVTRRYETALSLSERPEASGASERYTWAHAARGACGRAIGYLSTGEVNSERMWDCECYYARMESAR